MAFSFGNPGGNAGSTEKKTGTLFGSTTAPAGGLFAQSSQQPANQQATGGSSLFDQPQQANAGANVFRQSQPQPQPQPQQNAGSSLWGQPQQQQPAFSNSLFGSSLQPTPQLNLNQSQSIQQQREGLPRLRQSAAQPYAVGATIGHREKSVVDQIRILNDKWDPQNPKCVFTHYLYQVVEDEHIPYYGPSLDDDHIKWEEALANKPSPNHMPILARGFEGVADRITKQNNTVAGLRIRLHEINSSLGLTKDAHELNFASRITEAKRKHVLFTQRTLALAAKVQILRNRGYVMDQPEEELKKKLLELEKKTFDPVLGGRQEEIWARMSGVRERARILQEETDKVGKVIESQQNGELLSDDDQKALEKLLQDYDRQLEHLKKWVVDTKEEYEAWETEKQSRPSKR